MSTPESNEPPPTRTRKDVLFSIWQGFVLTVLICLAIFGLVHQQGRKDTGPDILPVKLWKANDKKIYDMSKSFILNQRCANIMKARHPDLYPDGLDVQMSVVGNFDWPIERFDVFKNGELNYPLAAFYCTAVGSLLLPDIRVNLNPSVPISSWE